MNTIDRLTDSSTALVQQARNVLQSANLPQWLETGAVLGVAKSGTRAATTLARRNPGVALAIGVVGAGVLAYRFYRKRAAAKIDVNATSHAKGRGRAPISKARPSMCSTSAGASPARSASSPARPDRRLRSAKGRDHRSMIDLT